MIRGRFINPAPIYYRDSLTDFVVSITTLTHSFSGSIYSFDYWCDVFYQLVRMSWFSIDD